MQVFFLDQNGIKLEISHQRKTEKFKYMKIKQHLHDQWVKEEIKGKLENALKWNEHENTTYQNVWGAATVVPPDCLSQDGGSWWSHYPFASSCPSLPQGRYSLNVHWLHLTIIFLIFYTELILDLNYWNWRHCWGTSKTWLTWMSRAGQLWKVPTPLHPPQQARAGMWALAGQ